MRVFISYATLDGLNLASKANQILTSVGHKAWIYNHNKVLGALAWRDISDCLINKSDAILYLCTNKSGCSWGQAQEAGYALNHRKKIIVIAIDGASVPLELTARSYGRINKNNYEDKIKWIALDLKRIVKRIQKLDPRVKPKII